MLRRLGGGRERAGGLVVAVAVGTDHGDHADEDSLCQNDDGSHGCTSFFCSFRQDGWGGAESKGEAARKCVIHA